MREFYSNIAKALLRGHAMFQLSHMLLAMNEADDGERHRMIASTERGDFIERSKLFRRSIENMLKEASRDLWKCNPNPYLDNRMYLGVVLLARFRQFDLHFSRRLLHIDK